MNRLRLAVSLIALQLAACSASENPSAGDEEALAAAREVVAHRMDNYLAQAQSENVPAMLDYWAPGARIVEPEVTMTDADLRGMVTDVLKTNRVADFKMTSAELAAHDGGAVVYQFGSYTESIQAKQDGAQQNYNNNFVARWIKSPDGAYRIDRFIAVPRPKDHVAPLPSVTNATPGPIANGAATNASAEVAQRMQDHVAAIQSNDTSAWLAFVSDDFQLFDSELQVLNKTEFSKLVSDVLGANRITDVLLKSDEISVHDGGQVAYQFGSYTEIVTPKSGAAATTVRANFLARWEKKDGVWLIDRFMATPMPKEPAPAK